MRHTLLPLQDRIVLRREYYMRLIIVFCFTLSLGMMVGIASLFPSFIHVLSVENDAKNISANLAKEQNNNLELKDIQKSVADSRTILNSLNSNEKLPKMSEWINKIVGMRKDLRFTSLGVTKVSSNELSLSIQGVAPTRNSLLAFKNDFEELSPNNKIDLPVSALAKSLNVPFSLQLTEKMP